MAALHWADVPPKTSSGAVRPVQTFRVVAMAQPGSARARFASGSREASGPLRISGVRGCGVVRERQQGGVGAAAHPGDDGLRRADLRQAFVHLRLERVDDQHTDEESEKILKTCGLRAG